MDTLIPGSVVALTTSLQTIYTTPAATTAVVTFMRVASISAGAATLRLYVVPEGGSAAPANAIAYEFEILSHDFLDMGKGLQLLAGSFIQASASSDGSLTLKLDVIASS